MLCLTLSHKTIDADLKEFWNNRPYIGLAELRIDCLDNLESDEIKDKIISFPSIVDVPVILTCRRKSDGGQFTMSEKKRLSIIKKCSEGAFSYVDIEEDSHWNEFEKELSNRGIEIIKSIHDFNGIPDNLFLKMNRMATKGFIPKVAVKVNGVKDLIFLFSAQEKLKDIKKKIIIGMGDYGVPVRILYKKIGCFTTFCSDNEVAPGMLSPRSLSELYRADRVNAQTHIFGIIGNPVMHTISPNIHNPGFHGIRFNAIYVPFLVDSVRYFFRLAEMLQIHGFSVTIPFKRDVIPYLGRNTREVTQICSCNTVIRERGMWKGINTDYYGFLSPIIPEFDNDKIKTALVIGAGGAARSIVWALRNHNCNVTILNRTLEHAKSLANETMSNYDILDNAYKYSGLSDIVVQTTSVGMEPNYLEDPVPSLNFSGKEIVYDLVYKPNLTKFLSRANEKKCKIVYGIDMLIAQGKLQFEAFSGYHYPPNVNPNF